MFNTTYSMIRRLGAPLFVTLIGLTVFGFVTFRTFGIAAPDQLVPAVEAAPDSGWILLINLFIGVSVTLFVWQLRWSALRVVLTVLVALLLGYVMTAFFNLDAASRYTQGAFEVQLLSESAPVETDAADIVYGDTRSARLNDPNDQAPLPRAVYRFAGQQGDVVTILAYAANRRTEIDLRLELLGPDGQTLAFNQDVTEAELERYSDLRSERDAAIADVVLPAAGSYTLIVEPQPLSGELIFQETIAATNRAYEALLLGPLSRLNRWAIWVQDAITLVLVGLAITVVFQARQFSLGAEGQLYFGALFSGFLALKVANLPPLPALALALLSAATAGFLWGLLPGILKAYLGANELVSTLMLNTVAMRFYDMALTFELKSPAAGFTTTGLLPEAGLLPVLVADTRVTGAVLIVVLAVFLVWLLLTRTTLGYEIRMMGVNRKFAEYGGINTRRTIMFSMALSGILAGLAGAHLGIGIHRQLILNISLGLAFEGVVVSLLARNNPLVVPFTGLLYAYLRAGAQFMERDANISFEIVRIIQAVIILLITAEGIFTFYQSWQDRRARLAAQAPDQSAETAVPHIAVPAPKDNL
jgi:simple sugar transport system permease protein